MAANMRRQPCPQIAFVCPICRNALRTPLNNPLSFSARRPPPQLRSRPFRRVTIRAAAAKKPPKVKSSYYKNPSKAIEKGGGFYIPGLRGPRLRVFVGVVAGSLLTLNHIAGSAVESGSLLVSETLAAIAVLSVLATAVVDIAVDESESSAGDTRRDENVGKSADLAYPTETATDLDSDLFEELAWTTAVSADLTAATGIAVIRGTSLIYASGDVGLAAQPGEAVMRVAKENKAVYIEDTSTLPPDVDFPFLTAPAAAWSVFLVPVNGGKEVVVFAAEKKGGSEPSFSVRDRAWLTQMSYRIGGSLGVVGAPA